MRTTKTDRERVKRFESAAKLLAKFNLQLVRFDPGIVCKTEESVYPLNFGYNEWEWLEPILRAHLKLKGFRVRGRR